MTKADLVEALLDNCDLTRMDAEDMVQIILNCVVSSLTTGEKVELRGFGSFLPREREARRGRNPRTGEQFGVPAKKVVYFKPGKELKKIINS